MHAELICTARAVFCNRAEQFIRTLCIIGGQSDTLYTWWSVGHFVYLVVIQALCRFGGPNQKLVVHILTLNNHVRGAVSVSY